MKNRTMKHGDTWPSLGATLFAEIDGEEEAPLDLLAAVSITLTLRGRDHTIQGPVDILDPELGKIAYLWQEGDTDYYGDLRGEFEINWGNDRITTVPSNGYFTVTIISDLDEPAP